MRKKSVRPIARVARIPHTIKTTRISNITRIPKGPSKGLLTRLDKIDISQQVDLPPREEKFCRLYIKQLNATECYLLAGFIASKRGTAESEGSVLLRKPRILIRLAQLWEKEKKSYRMDSNEVLELIAKIVKTRTSDFFQTDLRGNVTVKDLEKVDSALIENIQLSETQWGQQVKIKLMSKDKALDMLGKYHKLFGDTQINQTNITNKVQVLSIGGKEVEF